MKLFETCFFFVKFRTCFAEDPDPDAVLIPVSGLPDPDLKYLQTEI